MTLPDGRETASPLLPITLNGQRPGLRLNPPKLGEHGRELLQGLGYTVQEMDDLVQAGVVLAPE
jgi:crotonobetainyl-CoA:carnitine CoA-transferase CaiB-like acyl-CoA transferase